VLKLAVLVKKSTLAALGEHSVHQLSDAMPLSETEALVLLDADTVRRLLALARPEDTRIDDAIMRLAL
jgi:hypothetical protein